MKIGFDCLGLLSPKFPVDKFIKAIPNGVPIGVLDYSFGTDLTNLKKVLESGKVTAVRVHLVNAVCCRNRNCCSPDFKGDSRQLEKAILAGKFDDRVGRRTQDFESLLTIHDIKAYYSALLEHDQGEKACKRLMDVVDEAGAEHFINNPHSGWKGRYKDSLLETHNSSSNGQCSSLDGQKEGKGILGMSLAERKGWRAKTKKHEYVLSWCNELNLRGSGPRICPLKRKDNLSRKLKEIVSKTYK